MNGNRQMEVHYIDTGFPYTVTESFMDLFEGLAYAQSDFALAGTLQDQDCTYWPMHTNAYKYGLSGSGSTSYYGQSHTNDVSDHLLRTEGGRRTWDSPSSISYEEPQSVVHGRGPANFSSHTTSEECIRSHHNTSNSQILWQDNIDPDNMTYEELLDLGEAVGTQSRGLSQELISSLPVSKYKCSFFSRKKKRSERCVICQMDFKRGERQMTLPCKHIYHASCVTRWLSINKACPVCYVEVFGEESKR
ncbi:E3 ubiquitin-protein ligase BIG BROTHER isoform X2 [Aristolochia californica]|uniref:E3 ubiquitin-protein ligase BIG BROTHER isoform X2 n=1 Tax=Aristolochia californica TaxID=171875 RepID=UPI0035E20931